MNPAASEQSLLEFLKADGNLENFQKQLDAISKGLSRIAVVFAKDITGDNNPEFVVSIEMSNYSAVFFIGCQGGQYVRMNRILFDDTSPGDLAFVKLEAVQDINGDGINEVVYSFVANRGNRFTDYSAQALEWDGSGFRGLLFDDLNPGSEWNRYAVEASVEIKDIDGNRTMELLFPEKIFWNKSGMGIFMECDDGGVVRNSNSIWMWDGKYYHYMWREYVAPMYFYQAAYDGDLFSSFGLYDRAEAAYGKVLSDHALKPGSTMNWRRDFQCPVGENDKPDSTEPQRIKAYSRFRLVELYAEINQPSKGKAQWQYLMSNYPESVPGYIYAHLADVFWNEFQKKQEISAACALVRDESEENKEEVFGLFSEYGYQNSGPTVDDICSFS
jgi:hypothetical protein